MQLVSTFRALVIDPCLEEEESYAVRSRKLLVIAVAIATSNALLFGVPLAIVYGIFGSSTSSITTASYVVICAAIMYPAVTSSMIPYGYLRKTRKLPNWLVDLQMWSTIPTTLVFTLFIHHGSIPILCTCEALVCIVMRVRGWQFKLLYGIGINVLHALINDFGDVLPDLFNTFHSTDFLSVRIMYILGVNISPLLFLALGMHAIILEYVQRSDQADAAIAMNLAVAEKLRRYDTDGVAVILAANKGKIDEKLFNAFSAIQHNLQEYRPHIPDYVIAATITDGDTTQGGDDGDQVSEGGDCVSCTSDGSVICKRSRQSSNERKYAKSKSNSQNGSRHSTSLLYRRSATDSNNRGEGRLADSGNVAEQGGAKGVSVEGDALVKVESHDDLIVLPRHRQHFYGRGTTVFVRFLSEACGSDGGGSGSVVKGNSSVIMGVLSLCVDVAAKLAKVHNGALQYMQGCGLMVSFNAASRVATHENKACAFALALQQSVDELLSESSASLVMHATIVTTNVLSFFAGNSGQLMLTVLGGFMPQHTAMHHYLSQTIGNASSCVLVGESVVPTIDMFYDSRRIGVITMPKLASPSTDGGPLHLIVSQLLSHRQHNERDEWLYNTHIAHSDTTRIAIALLVDTAIEGVVPSTSEELATAATTDIVLDRCVHARLKDDKAPFALSATPIAMW